MSVAIFFAFSLSVALVGFIYVGFAIRHHWRLNQRKKLAQKLESP